MPRRIPPTGCSVSAKRCRNVGNRWVNPDVGSTGHHIRLNEEGLVAAALVTLAKHFENFDQLPVATRTDPLTEAILVLSHQCISPIEQIITFRSQKERMRTPIRRVSG